MKAFSNSYEVGFSFMKNFVYRYTGIGIQVYRYRYTKVYCGL